MRRLILVVIFSGALSAPGEEKSTPAAPTANAETTQIENKRKQATAEADQLEKAIIAYFTEYRRFPKISGAEPGSDTVTDSGAELIGILMAKDKAQNPRQIEFFSPNNLKSLDDSKNLLDPWGRRYRVIVDTDYNSRITVDGKVRPEKVHVQSLGPDSGR